MGLDIIKNLQSEVETLKTELDKAKSVGEEVKALEEKLGALEEKKLSFEDETVSDVQVKEAIKKASDLALKAKLTGMDIKSFDDFKEVASIVEKAIKPSDIDSWIDEQFSKEIIELMELELKVEKLFGTVTVPSGVGSLSLPQKTGGSQAYLIQPAQDAVESAITSGKVNFKPVKLKTLVVTAIESNQEAVINSLLSVVKEDIAYSLAKASETSIVNGDKTGAINATPPATDVTMAFDGLRKYGKVNVVDNGGSAITLAKIRETRKTMGVFGIDPAELVLLVNPNVFYQLLNIDELQTIDKYGSDAIVKTGTVAFIDGIAIVLSEKIPTDLNASGDVEDGQTLTGAVLVNTKGFKVGKRDEVEFEQDRSIVNDTDIYVGRVYRDFNKIVIGDNAVAYLVNIAS